MGSNDGGAGTLSTHRLEMIVRTLRHEVGDLLQSVYSAVAILQERLPRGQTLERTVLGDLRGRAEACKNELDAVHDLVCPFTLNLDWVELSALAAGIAASFTLRHSGLQIVCDAPQPAKIWGDTQKINQAGTMLMMGICQSARSKVRMGVHTPESNEIVEWSFTHDGPVPTAEQLSWLTEPFSTTRHARFGLGLAFAHRVMELHGGWITAGERPEGGFQVVLLFPLGSNKS